MNYPTETEHEAMGQRQRTEDYGKVLCECLFLFFVFFLPSFIPHLSMHLEKSRRLSVLWTIRNFSMISAEKVPGSFIFVIAVFDLIGSWSKIRRGLAKTRLIR